MFALKLHSTAQHGIMTQLEVSVPVGFFDLLRLHSTLTQQRCIMASDTPPYVTYLLYMPCRWPYTEYAVHGIITNCDDLQVSAWMWM